MRFLFIIMIFLILFSCSERKNTAPRIFFKSDTLNFGKIKKNDDPINVIFEFQNKESTTLNIKDIKTECGCTVAKLDKKKYASGEKGILELTYMPEKSDSGKIIKSVSILYNGNPPIHMIYLSGEIY